MRQIGMIFARSAAMALMISYYSIPFQIVAGGADALAKLRPFVISSSVCLVAFGFYQSRQSRRSKSPTSALTVAVLWFSAFVR